MKKHLAIILMLLLTLAGCGGNVPEDSVPTLPETKPRSRWPRSLKTG